MKPITEHFSNDVSVTVDDRRFAGPFHGRYLLALLLLLDQALHVLAIGVVKLLRLEWRREMAHKALSHFEFLGGELALRDGSLVFLV